MSLLQPLNLCNIPLREWVLFNHNAKRQGSPFGFCFLLLCLFLFFLVYEKTKKTHSSAVAMYMPGKVAELWGLLVLALLLTLLLLFLLFLFCFHTFSFLEVGNVFAPSFPFIFRVREFFITWYSLIRIANWAWRGQGVVSGDSEVRRDQPLTSSSASTQWNELPSLSQN